MIPDVSGMTLETHQASETYTERKVDRSSIYIPFDPGFLVAHVALHIPCLPHVSKVLDGTVVDEANKAQEMDVP